MDIEEAENILFQLKQSMELLDLVTGKPIEENTKLNIKAIETVLSELEKKDKIIDLIVEDFQNDGYLKGMSREEILDHYQERLWLKKTKKSFTVKTGHSRIKNILTK